LTAALEQAHTQLAALRDERVNAAGAASAEVILLKNELEVQKTLSSLIVCADVFR
jgi:hypothetical protein